MNDSACAEGSDDRDNGVPVLVHNVIEFNWVSGDAVFGGTKPTRMRSG